MTHPSAASPMQRILVVIWRYLCRWWTQTHSTAHCVALVQKILDAARKRFRPSNPTPPRASPEFLDRPSEGQLTYEPHAGLDEVVPMAEIRASYAPNQLSYNSIPMSNLTPSSSRCPSPAMTIISIPGSPAQHRLTLERRQSTQSSGAPLLSTGSTSSLTAGRLPSRVRTSSHASGRSVHLDPSGSVTSLGLAHHVRPDCFQYLNIMVLITPHQSASRSSLGLDVHNHLQLQRHHLPSSGSSISINIIPPSESAPSDRVIVTQNAQDSITEPLASVSSGLTTTDQAPNPLATPPPTMPQQVVRPRPFVPQTMPEGVTMPMAVDVLTLLVCCVHRALPGSCLTFI